jgi:phenylpropionate dioxygenase-like ring-hydroxylating dioxygenase large terminal subunit
VNRSGTVALAKRMLGLIDRRETDLADRLMYERSSAYTSPEVLQRERDLIFGRTATLLGLSADLPSPGSWRTLEMGDGPLLLWRGEDGVARLYLNSCRHRAVKVCEGAGQARSVACPFHGWRYAADGSLTGVPEPEGFEELARSGHGLIRLPAAEKYGLIFGCPVPGPPVDVDSLLRGLGPELAEWGFESFSLYARHHVHPFRGNWKFAWDTYCENYHFAFLHATTLSGYLVSRRQAVDFYGPHVRMVSALRSIDALRDQPEDAWEPLRHLSIQYRLYPSVSFSVFPDKVEVYWILPGTRSDEGHGLHAVYVRDQPETEQERAALDEAVRFGCEDIVNAEDLWITGQSEPGLRAPGGPGYVVFGRNEPVVQHFHARFREQIGDESLAGPPDARFRGD